MDYFSSMGLTCLTNSLLRNLGHPLVPNRQLAATACGRFNGRRPPLKSALHRVRALGAD